MKRKKKRIKSKLFINISDSKIEGEIFKEEIIFTKLNER